MSFKGILAELQDMHDKKQADYGADHDPYANVRASEDFGILGWVGCMSRANDKMKRIQKAAKGGKLANESIEDSLIDLAVYTIIALDLFRETAEAVAIPMEYFHSVPGEHEHRYRETGFRQSTGFVMTCVECGKVQDAD